MQNNDVLCNNAHIIVQINVLLLVSLGRYSLWSNDFSP